MKYITTQNLIDSISKVTDNVIFMLQLKEEVDKLNPYQFVPSKMVTQILNNLPPTQKVKAEHELSFWSDKNEDWISDHSY